MGCRGVARVARPLPESAQDKDLFLSTPLAELAPLATRWPQRPHEALLEVLVPALGDAVPADCAAGAEAFAARAATVARAGSRCPEPPGRKAPAPEGTWAALPFAV